MNRTFRALIWEQWRQHWYVLGAATLCIVLYALWGLIVTALDGSDAVRAAEEIHLLPWIVVGCAMLFLFFHGTTRDIRADFPRHLFVSPMKTSVLVSAQIGYKLVVGLTAGLLMGGVCVLIYKMDYPVWQPAAVLILIMAWGQTFACLLSAAGFAWGLFWFVVTSGVFFGFGVQALMHLGRLYRTTPDSVWALLSVVGVVAASWLWSWWLVSRARHGAEVSFARNALATADEVRAAFRRRDAFKTPAAAQRWFEWRQSTHHLPWIVAGAVGTTSLVALVARNTWFVPGFLAIPIPAAFGVGYYLLRCPARYSAFVMTRPISTKAIARAKLFAAIRAALATTAVLVGGWCVFWMLAELGMHHAFREFQIIGEGLSLIGTVSAGAFAAMTVGLPLLVTGIAAYIGVLIPLAAILYFQVMMFGADEDLLVYECYGFAALTLLVLNVAALVRRWPIRSYLPWLSLGTVVTLAALSLGYAHYSYDLFEAPLPILLPVVLGLVAHAEAHRRGLLTARGLVVAGLSFLVVVVAVLWYVNGRMPLPTALPDEEELMAVALLGAMWTSMAWLPLAVQWQRHR